MMLREQTEPGEGLVAVEEGGLRELLDTLRWRWKLMLLVTLGVFVTATLYVQSLPSTFTAEAVVAFAPRPDVETASADTVRVVVPKYLAFVNAPATIAEVAAQSGETPAELAAALDAEVAQDTGNLTIATELPNPRRAAGAANAFARAVTTFAEDDPLLTAQLVAPALPPNDPSGPARTLLQAAALAVGLLLALALSYVAETQRPRLRSWADMTRLTGYRVIGRVPTSRKLKTRPTEALADPAIGSAFRTLRTNLDHEGQDKKFRLLVVTSPDQGDGKTTISSLLAESIARLGKKVLLVDADLRRPNVAAAFKLQREPGLSEVMRGAISLEDAITRGWVEGLDVLTTRVDPDASDLLVRRFGEVMAEAGTRYETIVVDSPPLLGVADSRSLAAAADGVLLVVSSRTMADPVNEAVLALETLKAPVVGIIANRLREPNRAYAYQRG